MNGRIKPRIVTWLWIIAGFGAVWWFLASYAGAQEVASNTEAVGGVPTNVIMWSAIVGFLMPMAIAAINRYHWGSETKGVVAFLACLIAAAGTAFFSGDLTKIADFATAALFVFFSAIGSFRIWWQPSGIADKIERKTG